MPEGWTEDGIPEDEPSCEILEDDEYSEPDESED